MGVLLEDNETIVQARVRSSYVTCHCCSFSVAAKTTRSLVQMQPAYRCASGSPLLARFGNATDGCPQQFPNVTSIFGDGALGSHGGSGLSGVGGTIRYSAARSHIAPIQHTYCSGGLGMC
jgi:hypothetical protein